jgi:hypothetical protein
MAPLARFRRRATGALGPNDEEASMWKSVMRLGLACLATSWATAAPAGAQVQGLAVEPPSPCVEEAATFTVAGTGGCNGRVDFGDGSPLAPFTSLPFEVEHAYGAAATYTAVAASLDCGGRATVDVEVRTCGPVAGRAPERRIRPGRRAVAIPQIEGVLTFGIEPGAALMVAGRFFGEQPGRVRLLGSAGEVALEIESWSPTAIAGSVPQDVTAICPTGRIFVQRTDGVQTDPWQVQVPLESKLLPAEDVEVVSCGDDGNENSCNSNVTEGDACASQYFPPWFVGLDREGRLLGPQGPAAVGYHANCWGAVGDDSGTDTYRIALKNGWVLDRAQFLSSVPEGEGHTVPPSGGLPAGFIAGASSWSPSIDWSVTPGDAVIYNLYVTIRGPACASHR